MLDLEHARKEGMKEILGEILSIMKTIALAIVLAMLLTTYGFSISDVEGTSMSPTLRDGQKTIIAKMFTPKQGDIVVFSSSKGILVKRIIAGPGDMIRINEDGDVLVNEIKIDEPYIKEYATSRYDCTEPVFLGHDEYFVMGDNRSVSMDSRYIAIGIVGRSQMIGKVIFY